MPWSFVVPAAASIIGGVMQGNSARSAANTAANAQLQSAQIAADAAKFRPVGITSNFGTSNFGTDASGNLTSAGYSLSPTLQGIQNRLLASAGNYDPTALASYTNAFGPAAQNLFTLGQGYLATSPTQAAQDWMTAQQNLLAPGREQQLSDIRNQLFQSGRTGLATGGTTAGGMQQTNPELAAYYNSIANQNLGLASQAQQQGQAQTLYGAGLFNTGASLLGQIPAITSSGYTPLSTILGLSGNVEGMGQGALDIGAQLGGRQAQAGATQANALLSGGLAAANTNMSANSYNPWATALTAIGSNPNLGNAIKQSYTPPGLGQTTGLFGQTITDPTYGNVASSSWMQNPSFNPYENPI